MVEEKEVDESIPIFPASIPFGDLQKTHPEYSLKKIQKHNDLYEGGDAFRERIDRYLLKLQDEMYSADEIQSMYFASFNPKAESHDQKGEWNNKLQQYNAAMASVGKQWNARKARAWYPPIISGLIDFMIAAVFQNPPALVPGDPNVTQKETSVDQPVLIGETISLDAITTAQDYWHNFNLDCDGNGTSLREMMKNALLEIILNERAYLCIQFDKQETQASSFDQMKSSGGLDARLHLLKAECVDDWGCEDDGELTWVRTHRCSYERSQPYKQPDLERHCWTYITENASYEYELTFPINKPPPDETLIGVKLEQYSTGFPIIQIPCSVWIMERLADIALGLFNRQASLTWHLDKAAYALLVLTTKRALQTVVDSTLGAVRMDPGDSAQFVSPNTAIPEVLLKDIDRWKDELHSAVQAMVLQAASKDTGDRASGVAKQRDFGALSTLLTPFAMALKESLSAAARKILIVRKDTDVMLTCQGLDKFDVQSTEMKLANVLAFMGLPNAPETGKKFALADATLAMMSNAPTKSREQAIKEVQASSMGALMTEPPADLILPAMKPPLSAMEAL